MRFYILAALSVSIALIGGAAWVRSSREPRPSPSLVAVSNTAPDSEMAAAAALLESTTSAPTEHLGTTDLVSRQLVMDYLNLASNGQATPDNLNLLAAQYVEKIPSVNSVSKLSLFDLNIVPDSRTSLEAYSKALQIIENEHLASITKAYSNIDSSNTTDQELLQLVSITGAAYEKTASALKVLKVPESAASAHLDLVNNNFSIAYGLESASDKDTDPTNAFAGIVMVNTNLQDEQGLVDKINAILVKNGL